MNAAEFASRLLDLIATAVPADVPISKRLETEIDSLIDEFTTPPEPVLKLDEDRRMVYGWASVISKNGTPIIDRQGDVVSVDDLRAAVHDFMKHRTAGDMHNELGVGEVVESFVLDEAVQKSLGIDLGVEGWYVGVYVPNDDVWDKVKKGTYKAFSIGGSAVREPIPDEEAKGYTLAKGYKTLNDATPDADNTAMAHKKKRKKLPHMAKGGYGKTCKSCGKKCGPDGSCSCMKKADVEKTERWPAGSPGGKGGEFAPSRGAGRSSRSAGSKLTDSAGPAKKKPVKGGAEADRLFAPSNLDAKLVHRGGKEGFSEMKTLLASSPMHAKAFLSSVRSNYKNALKNSKKPGNPRAAALAAYEYGRVYGAMMAASHRGKKMNAFTLRTKN